MLNLKNIIKALLLVPTISFQCFAADKAELVLKFVKEERMSWPYQENSISPIYFSNVDLPNTVFFRTGYGLYNSKYNLNDLLEENNIPVKQLPGENNSSLSGMWYIQATQVEDFFKIIADEIQPSYNLIISHTTFKQLQKDFSDHGLDFRVPENLKIMFTRQDLEKKAKEERNPDLALVLALMTPEFFSPPSWIYLAFEYSKKEDYPALANKINNSFANLSKSWDIAYPFFQKNTDLLEGLKLLTVYTRYSFSDIRVNETFMENLVFFSSNNQNFENLDISSTWGGDHKGALNDSHADYISSIIKNSPNLRYLSFVDQGISDVGLTVILESVKNHPKIEVITLGGNRIKSEGKRMIEALEQERKIKFYL